MENIKRFYFYNINNGTIEEINRNFDSLIKPLVDELIEKFGFEKAKSIKTFCSFLIEINTLLENGVCTEEQLTDLINDLRDKFRKKTAKVIQYRKYESDRLQDYFLYKFFIYDISYISYKPHTIPSYLINRIDIFEIEQKYWNQIKQYFWNDSLEEKSLNYFDKVIEPKIKYLETSSEHKHNQTKIKIQPNIYSTESTTTSIQQYQITDFLDYLKESDHFIGSKISLFLDGIVHRMENLLFGELNSWKNKNELIEIQEFEFISKYKISKELFELISKHKNINWKDLNKSFNFFNIYFSPKQLEKEILTDISLSKIEFIANFLDKKYAQIIRQPIQLKDTSFKIEKKIYVQKSLDFNEYQEKKPCDSIINNKPIITSNIDSNFNYNVEPINNLIEKEEPKINAKIAKNVNLYLGDKYRKNIMFFNLDDFTQLVNSQYGRKLNIFVTSNQLESLLVENGFLKWNKALYINDKYFDNYKINIQKYIIEPLNEYENNFISWKYFQKINLNELKKLGIGSFELLKLFLLEKNLKIQFLPSGLIFNSENNVQPFLKELFDKNNAISREEQVKVLEEYTIFDIQDINYYFDSFLSKIVSNNKIFEVQSPKEDYKYNLFNLETETILENNNDSLEKDNAFKINDQRLTNSIIEPNLENITDLVEEKIDESQLTFIYETIISQNKYFITKRFIKRILVEMDSPLNIDYIIISLTKKFSNIHVWNLANDQIISISNETHNMENLVNWVSSFLMGDAYQINVDKFISSLKNYQHLESTSTQIINFISEYNFDGTNIYYDDYEEIIFVNK